MNEFDAWNSFWFSGRIYDYLLYKSIHNNKFQDDKPSENKNEIYDERTDSQRTEYR